MYVWVCLKRERKPGGEYWSPEIVRVYARKAQALRWLNALNRKYGRQRESYPCNLKGSTLFFSDATYDVERKHLVR